MFKNEIIDKRVLMTHYNMFKRVQIVLFKENNYILVFSLIWFHSFCTFFIHRVRCCHIRSKLFTSFFFYFTLIYFPYFWLTHFGKIGFNLIKSLDGIRQLFCILCTLDKLASKWRVKMFLFWSFIFVSSLFTGLRANFD